MTKDISVIRKMRYDIRTTCKGEVTTINTDKYLLIGSRVKVEWISATTEYVTVTLLTDFKLTEHKNQITLSEV